VKKVALNTHYAVAGLEEVQTWTSFEVGVNRSDLLVVKISGKRCIGRSQLYLPVSEHAVVLKRTLVSPHVVATQRRLVFLLDLLL
jgi:hypothetical protein